MVPVYTTTHILLAHHVYLLHKSIVVPVALCIQNLPSLGIVSEGQSLLGGPGCVIHRFLLKTNKIFQATVNDYKNRSTVRRRKFW
jgi:hypothetical protein